MSVTSFLVSILPVILIGLYIYKKDKVKESSKLLFKLFTGGILSCFPVIIFSSIIGDFFPDMEEMNFIQMTLYVFISIALIEELFKWIFLYKISYNDDEFDSLYDMIVYASFVALGFACFENVLYVSSLGIMTGLVRAISAVPGHVCDGILMGSYLSLAKVSDLKGDTKQAKKYKFLSILIPIISHGVYDLCLFLENTFFTVLFLLFLISLYVYCINKVKSVSSRNIKFKYKNRFCTNCGYPVIGRYCPRCGNKNN